MSRFVLMGIVTAGIFWALLAYGWWAAELSLRRLVIFVLLWLAGCIGFPFLAIGRGAFTGWIALLDIALILLIFKRDFKIPGQ